MVGEFYKFDFDGNKIINWKVHDSISSVDISKSGSMVAAGTFNGEIILCDVVHNKPINFVFWKGHSKLIT